MDAVIAAACGRRAALRFYLAAEAMPEGFGLGEIDGFTRRLSPTAAAMPIGAQAERMAAIGHLDRCMSGGEELYRLSDEGRAQFALSSRMAKAVADRVADARRPAWTHPPFSIDDPVLYGYVPGGAGGPCPVRGVLRHVGPMSARDVASACGMRGKEALERLRDLCVDGLAADVSPGSSRREAEWRRACRALEAAIATAAAGSVSDAGLLALGRGFAIPMPALAARRLLAEGRVRRHGASGWTVAEPAEVAGERRRQSRKAGATAPHPALRLLSAMRDRPGPLDDLAERAGVSGEEAGRAIRTLVLRGMADRTGSGAAAAYAARPASRGSPSAP